MAAQQDLVNYKDHVARLEKANHDLQYEVKNAAVHQETNELLKADLQKVRTQYQNDKQHMGARIQQLEAQLVAANTEGLKSEMRGMANRLMDLVNGHGSSGANYNRNSIPMSGIASHYSGGGSIGGSNPNPSPGGYNINMNSLGLNGGGGMNSVSSNNSYYGDDQNSDISGIYDMNSVATGVGNTSLLDDDDQYYSNLMQQTQLATQLERQQQATQAQAQAHQQAHQQAQYQQQQQMQQQQARHQQVQQQLQQQQQQQTQQQQQAQQQQKSSSAKSKGGKKSTSRRSASQARNSESEEEEEEDIEDNEDDDSAAPVEQPQRRKSKQKRVGSGSSVGSTGSKGKGRSGVLPRI
jgi:hypothetical protein